MPITQKISPCLWFDKEAEEAANYYTGIFRNSRITSVTRFSSAGFEVHHQAAGSVMVAAFELEGQPFIALNGGPQFKFNEAISFQVNCANQEEIDYYWNKLTAGGDRKAQQCGWLKDRFGVSWQIVPENMGELLKGEKSGGAQRAMQAMLKMKKIDIADIERARDAASA